MNGYIDGMDGDGIVRATPTDVTPVVGHEMIDVEKYLFFWIPKPLLF